jgi:ribosomal silencing factor RsfS
MNGRIILWVATITNKGQAKKAINIAELHHQQLTEKTTQIFPFLNGINLKTARAILKCLENQLEGQSYVLLSANTFGVAQTDNKYQ